MRSHVPAVKAEVREATPAEMPPRCLLPRAGACRPASGSRAAGFLEGATLGLGGIIGGIVTIPVAGFAILPVFLGQKRTTSTSARSPATRSASGSSRRSSSDPAEGDVSRRTAFIRNNGDLGSRPELHDHLEPLRAPGLSDAGERADGRHPRREERRRAHEERRDPAAAGRARRLRLPVPRQPVRHRGQPHGRPGRARARPLLVRHRRTATSSFSARTPCRTSSAPARRRRSTSTSSPGRASTSTGPSSGSIPSSRRITDGDPPTLRARRRSAASRCSRRSTIRSTGSRSARASSAATRYFLFRKVPGDTNWMQTLGSAALTAFIVQAVTGVILAMYYKPSPHDAYLVDPEHHRPRDDGLARARHAQVGRERLHHPHVPAHGARVPVRRVQVPARAELDHRRAACSSSG